MFDELLAQDHIEFLELLHLTGDFTGQLLKLLPWQRDVISNVYGTLDEKGRRQYQYAYLEIPKKNGKTELIASLAIDHCTNDAPGGQIYCCAAEREQASLVYKAAKSKIEQDEYLESLFRVVDSKKEIYNRETGTFIKVLSAEAYSKHGLNPSVVIFDELHALKKRDLWDVMTFGSGAARMEQLIWVITTAGDDPDKNSIGWEKHDYATKVRDGVIDDKKWFVRIYSAPEDADIYDENIWHACNPSLGITIDIDKVREEAQSAKNTGDEKNFRWLRLNQWVQLKRESWLPIVLWDRTQADWTREALIGEECYVGIDLSTTTDLSATSALFPPRGRGKWRFFQDAFIPESRMKERESQDHVPFRRWLDRGYIHATPGDSVDYTVIANHLRMLMRNYRVRFFCADKWKIEFLATLMGVEIAEKKIITIPQTIEGMGQSMHELERLFLAGEIEHEENQCGRWAFGNVCVSTDGNENKKPNKRRSIDRIDPTVALINAMAGAVRMENKRSAYEEHGVRTL